MKSSTVVDSNSSRMKVMCGQGSPQDETQDDERTDSEADSSSEYDTDLEEDVFKFKTEPAKKRKQSEQENEGIGHVTYEAMCRSLDTVPIRTVTDQLPTQGMTLHHVGMNKHDCKALAYALWENTCLESLDLQDNGLKGEDMVPVINVLMSNTKIDQLSLSENKIDFVAAMAIDELLRHTSVLVKLNLSGTEIGDKEIDYIASGIQNNRSLLWLDLSHNNIGIQGSKKLGRALSDVEYLQFVDLSWNHIRLSGAVALLKGIKENRSVVNLNLSMNGLGFEGSLALEETLRENTSLRVLDVSNNRINWEGVVYVARGLTKNSTLGILNIGENPLNMEGCCVLMKAVASRRCRVEHIGLENVPVNGAVLCMVQEVLKKRHFTLNHGGELETKDVIGIRKEKPVDPISLVVRYLAMTGIRIIDMFRMFDGDNDGEVSKADFINGMKKMGVPLKEPVLKEIASRLDKQGNGVISYSILVQGVRNHIRAERQDSRREELKEEMKLQKQRHILQTSLPPIFKRNYDDDKFTPYATTPNPGLGFRRRPSVFASSAHQLSITSRVSCNTSDFRDPSQILEEDEDGSCSLEHSQTLSTTNEPFRRLSRVENSEVTSTLENKTNTWQKYIRSMIERNKLQTEYSSVVSNETDILKPRLSFDRANSADKTHNQDPSNESLFSGLSTFRESIDKGLFNAPIGRRMSRSSLFVGTPKVGENRRHSVAQNSITGSHGQDKYNQPEASSFSLLPKLPSIRF